MKKENKIKFDFLPGNSFKYKIIGVALLGFCIIYYISNILLKWSNLDNNVFELFLAFSLFLISFSNEKEEKSNNIFIRYYAGKITSSFIFSFILALKIFEIIKNHNISISIIKIVILALIFYQLCLIFLKYIAKNKDVEVKDVTMSEVYESYPKFILFSIILSVLTLFAIILIK